MPFVRETSPNVFVEIDGLQTIVVHENGRPDVQWPGSIVSTWSADALAAIGVYWVEPAVVPPGYRVRSIRYERDAGIVTQVLVTALDLAGAAPPSMIAAILNAVLAPWGDIGSIEATFNVAALLYFDVGQYMVLLAEPQPDSGFVPIFIGTNGITISATDKGVDYLTLEARNGAGEFADPLSFTMQAFRV
jgi:hypothetical protein